MDHGLIHSLTLILSVAPFRPWSIMISIMISIPVGVQKGVQRG
jgi:ABC-type microcin C transport system permease subunit YejB